MMVRVASKHSAARTPKIIGSTKNLYESPRPGMLIQEFKKNVADNGLKKPPKLSRAILANEISSYLFSCLEGFRIPTHFVEKISASEMLVRQLDVIPFKVRVVNIAIGSFCKRFGVKKGFALSFPIIEHYYKRSDLGQPLLNEFHVYSLGLATPEQLSTINRLASKANVILKSFFERRGLKLISIDLEFGVAENRIMIGDEISPRTCHFIDIQKATRREKPRFLGNGACDIETYIEVRNRLYRTS